MLTFDEEHHKYYDGEIELPSVTIITRFCSYDSINGNGVNPFYRDRGTLVHELCAEYDFTGELPKGTGVDGFLKGYADFKRDYQMSDWLFVEYMMGNAEIGFAGTIDRIGYVDGQLAIVDLKTASKPNTLALTAQLTGYLLMFEFSKSIELEMPKLYGLQLQKKGDYKLIPIEPDFELFEACQILHRRTKK